MPDVTLLNIVEGIQRTWADYAPLDNIVPAERLYAVRVPAGIEYPNASITLKDVSAYFGGTEYFSGSTYVKKTQCELAVFGNRNTDWKRVAQAMSDAFGWSSTNVPGTWNIENAVVLAAMPETEGLEVFEERQDGEDILKYTSSFTILMQAERG